MWNWRLQKFNMHFIFMLMIWPPSFFSYFLIDRSLFFKCWHFQKIYPCNNYQITIESYHFYPFLKLRSHFYIMVDWQSFDNSLFLNLEAISKSIINDWSIRDGVRLVAWATPIFRDLLNNFLRLRKYYYHICGVLSPQKIAFVIVIGFDSTYSSNCFKI